MHDAHQGRASRAGALPGWLSRVTGRGAGATISGRVINEIAPHAARRARRRPAGSRSCPRRTARPPPPGCSPPRCAPAREPVASNDTGANLTSGIAPRARARRRSRASRCSRSTSGSWRGSSTRSAPSCSCSATSAATSSTATARCTRVGAALARGRRAAPRPARRRQRVRPARGVGGGAGPGRPGCDSGSRGEPTPRRAPPVRGAARLGRATGSPAPRAASPNPTRRTGSTATTLVLGDDAGAAAARAARTWNRDERRARAHRRGRPLRGRRRRSRPAAIARRRHGRRALHDACPWPTDAGRACSSRRTRPGGREVLRWVADTRCASRRSRSTRASPTARTRRGCGTCRTRCCAVCPSRPRASAASTSRFASATRERRAPSSKPDPLRRGSCAARRRARASSHVHAVLRAVQALRRRRGAMRESAVRVGLVYPELLGTYGDRGNAVVLVERCRWRGIDAELVEVAAGGPIPDSLDVYLFGGGEDDPQTHGRGRHARRRAPRSSARAARGAVVFAVCAGFQLHRSQLRDGRRARPRRHRARRRVDRARARAGSSARSSCNRIAPAPDAHRLREPRRPDHARPGRPPARPGRGRRGQRRRLGTDGVLGDRLVGTYLHGPVLPRNPALADHLLAWVVGDAPRARQHLEERLRADRLHAGSRTGLARSVAGPPARPRLTPAPTRPSCARGRQTLTW